LGIVVTLTSLAVLITTMLLIPVDMALHMDVHGKPRARTRFVWLFGLVTKEVTTGKTKTKKGINRAKTIFNILRTKGLLRQLKSLLRDVISHLKVRDLGTNLRVGLGDPADTGFLFALIGPATVFLNSSVPYPLRVQPSFDDKVSLEGSLDGTVRLRPIKLVIPTIRFACSPAAIKAVTRVALTGWKRR